MEIRIAVWFAKKLRVIFFTNAALAVVLLVPNMSRADIPIIGVGAHLQTNTTRSASPASLLRDLGITSYRDDFSWASVEKKRGSLDLPTRISDQYAAMDAFSSSDGALLILDYGNRWYGSGGFPRTPQEVAAFARYSGFVANALKGKVRMFEIWNEWNIGAGGKTGKRYGDPGEYVTVLRAASEAVKRANPAAMVIAGAVGGFDDPWVTAIIEKGALKYADGISIHPYVHCNKPSNATPEASITYLDGLQLKLTKMTGRNSVPIYVTEIGWPTHTGRCGFTPQAAANNLVRFYVAAAARSFIKGVWWYDLLNDGPDPANREHNFGLLTVDKKPKPAFYAMRNTAELLKSVNTAEALATPPGVRAVLLKKSDGSATLVAWTDAETTSCAVALDNKSRGDLAVSWRRLATDGAPAQSNRMSPGGKLNVRCSAEPLALETKFGDVNYTFLTGSAAATPSGVQLH